MKNLFSILMLVIILFSCSKKEETNTELIDEEPLPCTIDMENFDYSFGIDYNNPDNYLTPGEQSDLDDNYVEAIRNAIGTPDYDINGIKTICHWVNQNMVFSNAGGEMIGKKTANELYESKTFYGCHSQALIISSILREFGFPVVMIETASIVWAKEYNKGTNQGFAGHVMSEVYVLGKWILLDNNCTYVEDYDVMNPYISTMDKNYQYNKQGLFVYTKGIDIWEYGVRSHEDTHKKMIQFATNINCFVESFYTTNYVWKDL
ncbi:MAG: transglutaminase domain-containing protein [Bacteroidota bacterium]